MEETAASQASDKFVQLQTSGKPQTPVKLGVEFQWNRLAADDY